jgi:hypothetical protein
MISFDRDDQACRLLCAGFVTRIIYSFSSYMPPKNDLPETILTWTIVTGPI